MSTTLSPERQQQIVGEFYNKGFAVVPRALSDEQTANLRALADRFIDDPPPQARGYTQDIFGAQVLRCTQALHRAFADLLIHEPILSLAQAVLGPNLGFCGQNVIRSDPGTGIAKWHVDDIVEFALPENVSRHDRRIRLPVFWFSFQIALSDIGAEDGPTEVVPASHYSGRPVPEEDKLEFEGQGPVPILCRAGDVYLFNHQLWHRGSVNRSQRRRYLMQNQYCCAWGLYRFNSIDANQRLPEAQSADLPPRLAQLLEPTRKLPR